MAWNKVADAVKGGSANGVTTDAADFSAATFIIVNCSWYTGSTANGTLTDSTGANTYNALTRMTVENIATRMFWTIPAAVSGSMTFSYNGTDIFPSIQVLGFTGNHASPFDQESAGGSTTISSTAFPGSLTPSEDNCLIVTSEVNENNSGGGAATISGTFTAHAVNYSGGNSEGGGIAYLIQTTAEAVNPAWNIVNVAAGGFAAIQASFKAAADGGLSPNAAVLALSGLAGRLNYQINMPDEL